MLEVHAILQRQRCKENMTEKTGTLSDAYVKQVIVQISTQSQHITLSFY